MVECSRIDPDGLTLMSRAPSHAPAPSLLVVRIVASYSCMRDATIHLRGGRAFASVHNRSTHRKCKLLSVGAPMSTVPPTSCRRMRARGTTSVVDAAPIREIRMATGVVKASWRQCCSEWQASQPLFSVVC